MLAQPARRLLESMYHGLCGSRFRSSKIKNTDDVVRATAEKGEQSFSEKAFSPNDSESYPQTLSWHSA